MKKSKGNTIRLGIFVTLGLVLLTIGIYYIGKRQQMFSDTFRIRGIFRDISGLEVGNNVRFSGINVGIIENIRMIADTAVEVDLTIQKKSKEFIKKDSKATIGSDGLMGGKIVVLQPGTPGSKEIENNDFIGTSSPVSIDDIMGKLKTTLTNAASMTEDLTGILGNMRAGKGAMGKLFMDPTTAKNLDQTIVNIKEGAGGFKNNMDAASHNFLLRGYLKKKAKKDAEKKMKDGEKKN